MEGRVKLTFKPVGFSFDQWCSVIPIPSAPPRGHITRRGEGGLTSLVHSSFSIQNWGSRFLVALFSFLIVQTRTLSRKDG